MDAFFIDLPVPSMGATVNELTVIDLLVVPGNRIAKGQKLAELESDKSVFDFESPCDGTVVAVQGRAGDILASGAPFLRIETAEGSLKHLEVVDTGKRKPETGNRTQETGSRDPATENRMPEIGKPG